jgi:hypothetical protein
MHIALLCYNKIDHDSSLLSVSLSSTLGPDDRRLFCCSLSAMIDSFFALSCESSYLSDDETRYQTTETMIFEDQGGYMVPNRMEWFDMEIANPTQSYCCESFEFALLPSIRIVILRSD